jgi:hypothetical protein
MQEHRFKSFENKVLRRIFGPKREEVAGGWRTLHNEELLNLFTSPYVQIEENEMRGSRSMRGKNEKYILNYGWKI